MGDKMIIKNLSGQPEGVLRSWLPHDLQAERVVFLPDACPGRAPLPTGTVVLTKRSDWRSLALGDCGCGMRLLRSSMPSGELTLEAWDEIADRLKQNKGKLGDLGGGNHFLDALLPYDEDILYFLIHTGSRHESRTVEDYVDSPVQFDSEFERVTEWAESNRARIQETVASVVGELDLVLDRSHNGFEKKSEGVVIRKGAVKAEPGDKAVIPSHMSGDITLVEITDGITEVLCSVSHGTGRRMSRSDAKDEAVAFDFDSLREKVLLPSCVKNTSLRTEGPFAYRGLDKCLELLDGYVNEIKRFAVFAYAGHL